MARKRAVVWRLMRGEPAELLARGLGVPLHRLARWREPAQTAIAAARKARETDGESAELAAAMQRIGNSVSRLQLTCVASDRRVR